ncbi:MAG TPA: hypothetical protein VG099_23365 [Gemmataceae bacterium]|jgi:hypothetical protein|nr:hypothetical protein [Gemmataceae bacterium]
MAIDKSGKWWKGATEADALEYLNALELGGYPVDEVFPQSCECGSTKFRVYRSDEDELSYLVCSGCRSKTFITDSQEHDDGQDYELTKCPCKSTQSRVFLGVHSINDKAVANWISIGVICAQCGVLRSPLDWEFDTERSEESFAKHTRPLPRNRGRGSVQPKATNG